MHTGHPLLQDLDDKLKSEKDSLNPVRGEMLYCQGPDGILGPWLFSRATPQTVVAAMFKLS